MRLSGGGTVSVSGNIDRVTGAYTAHKTLVSGDKKETTHKNFEGTCEAAKPLSENTATPVTEIIERWP